jgi:hypothetical protein
VFVQDRTNRPGGDSATLDGYTAEALLAMPLDRPERLFPRDRARAKALWRQLCRVWHPDRSAHPRARWVFAHLETLYRAAQARQDAGLWDAGGELFIDTRAGTTCRLAYVARGDSDLGTTYLGRRVMAYRADDAQAHLLHKAFATLERLPFADAGMREAMAPHLPVPLRLLEARDTAVMVLRKREDFVALTDLLRHLGGTIAPRHVAWSVSGLLDIVCYLEWAGLVHMDVSPASCLVSPARHGVALAGGWWCAEPSGAPICVLPARSLRVAPAHLLDRRRADAAIDAALVREVGWELLGADAREAPAPMLEFLTLPRRGDAVADYEAWQRTLWRCFGERRFSDLGIDAEDIYPKAS